MLNVKGTRRAHSAQRRTKSSEIAIYALRAERRAAGTDTPVVCLMFHDYKHDTSITLTPREAEMLAYGLLNAAKAK